MMRDVRIFTDMTPFNFPTATLCRAATLAFAIALGSSTAGRAIAADERHSQTGTRIRLYDAHVLASGCDTVRAAPLHRSSHRTRAASRPDARRFLTSRARKATRFYEGFRQRLQRLPVARLDPQTQADYELLQNAVGFAFYSLDQEQFYRWKPQLYPRTSARRCSQTSPSSTLRKTFARAISPRGSRRFPRSSLRQRESQRVERHFPARSSRIS
jgi:hypothetical protein